MNGWKEISRLVDDDARCAKILNMEEEGLQTERHVLRSKAEYRRTPTVFGELHSTCCCRDCTAVLADIQQCCATCNEMKVNVVESANSCARKTGMYVHCKFNRFIASSRRRHQSTAVIQPC